jgi:U3 small nucleolar RNA-associated protein 3
MGLDEKEGTRKVTREILKNKGLVRNRRKDKRNSRVKHKKKYEKALIK